MLAPLVQTSVDVIERWPPEKTLAYFDAAMRVQQMKNGTAVQADEHARAMANDIEDALGFSL